MLMDGPRVDLFHENFLMEYSAQVLIQLDGS